MGKWSEEAKLKNRRRNKARRAFKSYPLLAWEQLRDLYENDYFLFLEDVKKLPKTKGRNKKYSQKELWAIDEWNQLKIKLQKGENVAYSLVARLLRLSNSKDYLIAIRFNGMETRLSLSKKLSRSVILDFQKKINECNTQSQVDKIIDHYISFGH
jgi:hypothetical protein